jgi:hypothetical protein
VNIERLAAVLLDRARLSLPCRSEGHRPSGGGSPHRSEDVPVSYEYRVSMVREAKESPFLHLSAEPIIDATYGHLAADAERVELNLLDAYNATCGRGLAIGMSED